MRPGIALVPWMLAACTVGGPTASPTPASPPVANLAPTVARPPVAVEVPPETTPSDRDPIATVPPPWDDDDLPRIRAVAPLVERAAARHGLDPGILDAIIWHESRFQPKARGPGGAAGLMQLMPSTSKGMAKRMGVANRPYDARFNVDAGALLMSRLIEIFDGDVDLALAGYALGHGAVKRRIAEGEALPERTQRFIRKVNAWAPAFAQLHAPTPA